MWNFFFFFSPPKVPFQRLWHLSPVGSGCVHQFVNAVAPCQPLTEPRVWSDVTTSCKMSVYPGYVAQFSLRQGDVVICYVLLPNTFRWHGGWGRIKMCSMHRRPFMLQPGYSAELKIDLYSSIAAKSLCQYPLSNNYVPHCTTVRALWSHWLDLH